MGYTNILEKIVLGKSCRKARRNAAENCPLFPRVTMIHGTVNAFEMSFKLNLLSTFWSNISFYTHSRTRELGWRENVETCLGFSVLNHSHAHIDCAGECWTMHFSGNGTSHQTIRPCWFHLPNISWIPPFIFPPNQNFEFFVLQFISLFLCIENSSIYWIIY